jgi:hypothetical protein
MWHVPLHLELFHQDFGGIFNAQDSGFDQAIALYSLTDKPD